MRIHHVAFRTDDVPRLEAFYAGVLGLPIAARRGANVWLDAGGSILMLERREAGEPAIQPGTMEIVTFSIRPEECANYTHRLAIEARTAYTLYVRDPDGRRVGLSSYPEPLA